jgi:sugar-specific transcriptional regulator TrmB
MVDLEKLEQLGLTKNEASIYRALLETGETKTGALVKKTGFHRVIIYDALESLIKKGLASYVIKENIKYFQAADPSRLIDFLEEKQQLAKSLLPQLNILRKESSSKQQVSIYEGIRGLKSAMNNMLKELTIKDKHAVFASGHMADMMGSYYTIFQNTKKKKNILTKVLYDEHFRKRVDITKVTYGEIKFTPISYFPTDTWIYKNKVLIVTYTSKPPFAILITSKETADSYMKIFEGFWKNAKK